MSSAAQLNARIRKRLRQRGGPEFSLDVEFAAPPGFTILFGASGAGKTRVLDCVAGLLKPDEGSIAIGERAWFDREQGIDLSPRRRSVGYLLQSLALFPHMTVQQNVEYGLDKLPPSERERRTREVLQSFHIHEFAGRRPREISGGERQRVALARALVRQPDVLLLDEPLVALDALTKARILDDLREWNRRQRIPVLYVTHDREEAFALGENLLVLERGRVVAQGSPHEVLAGPRRETVAQLAGFENIFDGVVVGSHPEQGTMTCRISGSPLALEVPLVRVEAARPLRIGIRAGDILLATSKPESLSARNIIPGELISLEQRGVMLIAGVEPASKCISRQGARESLQLEAGMRVWLVIKTYSCHVLQ